MSRYGMVRVAAAVVCSLVLSGCGDSAGPADYDAVQMRGELDGLVDALTGESNTPMEVAGEEVRSFLGDASMDTLLGRTWVYDDASSEYVASARTGAPADGTRFIVYQVAASGNYATPLVEVGYVDIRKLDTASRREARLVAVIDGETVADYIAYATGDDTYGTFGYAGFVELGGQRADVTMDGLTAAQGGGSHERITYSVEIAERELRFESMMDAPYGGSTGSNLYTAMLEGRGGRLDLDGADSGAGFAGTLTLNGEEVASFTDDNSDSDPPVFSPTGEHTVTAAEATLVAELLEEWAMGLYGGSGPLTPVGPVVEPMAIVG